MARDLYTELETALRRPEPRLLIDELLPAPEKIPSSIPTETPIPATATNDGTQVVTNLRETLDRMTAGDINDTEPEPAAPAASPATAPTRPTETARPERNQRIEDEVQEFLALQRARGVHGSPGLEEGDDPNADAAAKPKPAKPKPSGKRS